MATRLTGKGKFGVELAKIFGQVPSKTKSIVIEVEASSVVVVHITQFVDEEQGDKLLDLFGKYDWAEDEEGE
jgi:predicted SnoaL-like aldol condensation-catalyzing enzyme